MDFYLRFLDKEFEEMFKAERHKYMIASSQQITLLCGVCSSIITVGNVLQGKTQIIMYDIAFACAWWLLYTVISRGSRIFAVLRLLIQFVLACVIQKFASVLKGLGYGEFLIFFNSILLTFLFILISKSSGWVYRSLSFTGTLFIFLFNYDINYQLCGDAVVVIFILANIIITFVFYKEEQTAKLTFLNITLNERRLLVWKDLVNKILKTSVLIFRKTDVGEKKDIEVGFSIKFINEFARSEFREQISSNHTFLDLLFNELQNADGSPLNTRDAFEEVADSPRPHIFLPQCRMRRNYNKDPIEAFDFYDLSITRISWENDDSCILVMLSNVTHITTNKKLKEIDEFKDSLICSISHSLRTPLHGIAGSVEMASSLAKYHHMEFMQYIDEIHLHVKSLTDVIDDVIDYSNYLRDRLKPSIDSINVREMLSNLESSVCQQWKLKDSIKFAVFCDKRVPKEIRNDPQRLHRAIMNLICNAMKFTFKGNVSLHIDILSERANLLKITVKDSGTGIPGRLLKKICNLSEASARTGGVGLGLTITKIIVGLVGPESNLDIQSEINKGSSISFLCYCDRERPIFNDHNDLPDCDEGDLHSASRLRQYSFSSISMTELKNFPFIRKSARFESK